MATANSGLKSPCFARGYKRQPIGTDVALLPDVKDGGVAYVTNSISLADG
jgi:hypothetical protein